MSSVASIGSSSQSQLIQQILQGKQSCETQESPALGAQEPSSAGSAASTSNNQRAQFQANFQSAAQALGIDTAKFKDIQNQIRSAVTDAKTNGANPSKAQIDQVVNDVLTKNGVDPAEFKSQMQALHQKMGGHRHHHKAGSDSKTSSTTSSSSTPNTATITGLGSPTDASSTSGIESLVNTLPAGSLVDANA